VKVAAAGRLFDGSPSMGTLVDEGILTKEYFYNWTALRWMTQGETFYHHQCVEHWVWNQGILFTDYGRELVKELMGIVEFVKEEEYA